ncbi:winged helix-turn-helix domain-containing protein [Nesterenkonia muleiensis]|uniref:winged helix-turn-helix domain-containing protein n=1 Tax=Nesterenkonia muleiensis TaxID=2282648 RepID=UPI000E76DD81|nr:helix-turn-helix domain-containing protein [Nesterenkonia muleiensis]
MNERKPSGEEKYETLPGEAELQMDTKAMKAFAHPLRMAMFTYLNDRGSATATTLATHLGESTGQTSYHLRQLEKHGLVSEDTEKGTGRERWWKPMGFSVRRAATFQDPANRPALDTLMEHQLHERSEALRGWLSRMGSEPEEWMHASLMSSSTATMTSSESHAMITELMQVIDKHTDAAKGRVETEGEGQGDRRVRLYISAFPLQDPDQD